MKRFLVVLLALGLIVAFSAPATAADVKFSGSYQVMGQNISNPSLQKDAGSSSAFYNQRLRIQTVFQVAEGLKLTTRFDAMERVWGQESLSAITGTAEKNIQWERAYATFNALGGTFDVGYQSVGGFGTVFADAVTSGARIKYTFKSGPYKLLLLTDKANENDLGGNTAADKDYDKYGIAPIYSWDGGNAGILIVYYNDATYSAAADDTVDSVGYKSKFWLFNPYFKTTIGPVYLEGEGNYKTGKKKKFEGTGATDIDYDSLSLYLMGKVDLGQFYVGGQFAYVEGDDADATKDTAGVSGQDYNPCLLLFMDDQLNKWAGNLGTNNTTGDVMTNATLYQGFAGFKPLPKLDVMASFTFAKVDEQGSNVSDDLGSEFDITATYKIYDNLSYMVGFGYLWAGDYFKGTSATNEIDDTYMVMNKLTLKF